ncbi:MAG: type II toxin-antitoxin system RelE/ParE family toxin [Desulfovibrionaceae bacterium]|jgi:toxin ParE1/3/4|nr:type II toxin-antitoxin system RelE/ParE family toxin [Desulfovibrionaceae bacterium]
MSGDKRTWRVAFTRRAEEDILGIFSFIADRDGPDIAETTLGTFIEARDSLRELPDRGRIPPELKRINVLSYREIQVSRYRVVYQVNKTSNEVYIHVVADGRRNFTELLKERLLTASPRGSNAP